MSDNSLHKKKNRSKDNIEISNELERVKCASYKNSHVHPKLKNEQIERLTISMIKDQNCNKMDINKSDASKTLWGPQRVIILEREENQSLGVSIVGGKLDVSTQKGKNIHLNFISGIFIKHVQENSPAGFNGNLKTGDRILAVNDADLTESSHDQAVSIIKNAKSPVKFLIQSLICIDSHIKLSNENSKDEFTIMDNSNMVIKQPNKYNYSIEAIREKYSYLLDSKKNSNTKQNILEESEIFIFYLQKSFPNQSLGLSLSGNVNLNKTSVFVCGIHPNSIAQKHGLIKIGDQILEINGQSIYGRAHSNVTPLIKNIKDLEIYLIVYRNSENLKQMFKPNKFFSDLNCQLTNQSFINLNEQSIKSETVQSEPYSNSISLGSSISADSESLLSSLSENQLIEKNTKPIFNSIIQRIVLKKKSNGFGIAISEDKNGRLMIRGLNSNGVASKDGGMQVGDEILAINKVKIDSMKYEDIMNLLQSTDEPVEFEISKKETTSKILDKIVVSEKNFKNELHLKENLTYEPQKYGNSSQDDEFKSPKIKSSEIFKHEDTSSNDKKDQLSSKITNDDPKFNIIKVGQETWIEIDRNKIGLGLSIIGGSDTQLPGIIIHDIYQNGAAFNDQRLAIGDQILKVNEIDLLSATHNQALNALRQTSDYVKLLIHRSFCNNKNFLPKNNINNCDYFNDHDNERYMNIITIELNKKFGKGLGFSIIGRKEGSGVFISHIINGGCAYRDGRLTVGDLILEVNNQNIRESSYNDVAFLLKTLPQGKVTLKIGRFQILTNKNIEYDLNETKEISRWNLNLDLNRKENFENSIASNKTSTIKICKKK